MVEVGRLNDVEAARLAAAVERTSHAFYTEAARLTDHRQTERTLSAIAKQEEGHRTRCEALVASLVTKRTDYWGDPAVEDRIRALITKGIFRDVATARALAQALETEVDALRLALKIEQDTVLFYAAAAGAARFPDAVTAFTEIGEEEKQHAAALQSDLDRLLARRSS